MMLLPNGCSCSNPIISPKNCNTTARNWQIQCRFYDPLFKEEYPKGFLVVVKKGLNRFKELPVRREVAKIMLDALVHKLKVLGFNPITNTYLVETQTDYEIHPDTPIIKALTMALDKIQDIENITRADIKSVLKYCDKSARQLRLDSLPIKDVKRRHLISIIENCGKTANRSNKYKNNLSILFEKLIDLEAVEMNPTASIRKKKVLVQPRKTFTTNERQKLDSNLKKDHYELWRFMQIFFHSGARKTELCRIKGSEVNLAEQTYRALIKKGKNWVVVEKVIKNIALPFWVEIMASCRPDDYVFGFGFKPGARPTLPDYINKIWYDIVKVGYEIDADFYSLKHLNTSEVIDTLSKDVGIESAEIIAAKLNSHTTTKMVSGVYDLKNKSRKNDALKNIANPFA